MPKIHGSFVEQELKLVSLINAFKENNDNTIRILDQFAKDAASLKEHLAPHRNLWVARLG
jgi:hypothetical protein